MAAEEAARAAELKAEGGAPQPVTLSAKLVDDGPVIPSGLAWRVYAADLGHEVAMSNWSRAPIRRPAVLSLPPGEYLVQAAYGFAQATDTVTVTDAPQPACSCLTPGRCALKPR